MEQVNYNFSNQRTINILCLFIAILLFVQAVILLNLPLTDQIKICLVLQTILLGIFTFCSKINTNTYLNPALLVFSSLYFWHTPMLLFNLINLNVDFTYTGNFLEIGADYLSISVAFISLCMAFFVFGSLFGYKKKFNKRLYILRKEHNLAFYEQIPFFLIFTITNLYFFLIFFSFLGQAYIDLYSSDLEESILARTLNITRFLCIPAILLLFNSLKKSRSLIFATTFTIFLIIINILMGSRSMPFIYSLTLLVAIDYYIRKISFRLLILVVLIASAASYIIAETRDQSVGFGIFDFNNLGKNIDFLNLFWSAGGVIRNVIRTFYFAEVSPPLYGSSFLYGFLIVIPSPILDWFGLLHFFYIDRPSQWLINNSSDVPENSGLGFSLIAEVYLNFKLWGCLAFFPLGWFFATQFIIFLRASISYTNIFILSCAIFLTLGIRNDSVTWIRYMVYTYIILLFYKQLSIPRDRSSR